MTSDRVCVWAVSSSDEGLHWTSPAEITASVKLPDWTWYATGPGVGIQLQSGRLLIPSNHAEDVHEPNCPYLANVQRSRMVAHAIYSDDHGATWHIGGVAAKHTNESTISQLGDGRILLNARDWSGRFLRAVQFSSDDGASWQKHRYDHGLTACSPRRSTRAGARARLQVLTTARRPVSPQVRPRAHRAEAAGVSGLDALCAAPRAPRRESRARHSLLLQPVVRPSRDAHDSALRRRRDDVESIVR